MKRATLDGRRCPRPVSKEVIWEYLLRPGLEAEASKHPLGIIPAPIGGRLFRDLALQFSAPDGVVERVARQLGFWPWTPGQVVKAVREAAVK
jgi:hypothetical protein